MMRDVIAAASLKGARMSPGGAAWPGVYSSGAPAKLVRQSSWAWQARAVRPALHGALVSLVRVSKSAFIGVLTRWSVGGCGASGARAG